MKKLLTNYKHGLIIKAVKLISYRNFQKVFSKKDLTIYKNGLIIKVVKLINELKVSSLEFINLTSRSTTKNSKKDLTIYKNGLIIKVVKLIKAIAKIATIELA